MAVEGAERRARTLRTPTLAPLRAAAKLCYPPHKGEGDEGHCMATRPPSPLWGGMGWGWARGKGEWLDFPHPDPLPRGERGHNCPSQRLRA